MPTTKTWPYGTTRNATVLRNTGRVLFLGDDEKEGHVLVDTGHDQKLGYGDIGTITFTQGGPTGGFWKFTQNEIQPQNNQ